MQYIEEHEQRCAALLERAEKHIKTAGISPTYLCRKAGVQIHALRVLKSGTATPKTMQGLSDYLDSVIVSEDPDPASPPSDRVESGADAS